MEAVGERTTVDMIWAHLSAGSLEPGDPIGDIDSIVGALLAIPDATERWLTRCLADTGAHRVRASVCVCMCPSAVHYPLFIFSNQPHPHPLSFYFCTA